MPLLLTGLLPVPDALPVALKELFQVHDNVEDVEFRLCEMVPVAVPTLEMVPDGVNRRSS